MKYVIKDIIWCHKGSERVKDTKICRTNVSNDAERGSGGGGGGGVRLVADCLRSMEKRIALKSV